MTSRSPRDIYDETLAVFDRPEHRYEPLTTPEVADALDANRRTVYKRLQKLVDRGALETKETGSNSRVWWRPPDESSTITSSGRETEDTASGPVPSDVAVREANTAGRDTQQPVSRRQTDVNYREIFERFPDGVSVRDPTDYTLVDVNQQLCEMLGYTREELLAVDFEELHPDVPPHTSERAKEYIEQTVTDGPQTLEWSVRTKDGDLLPIEVHLRRASIDDEERILAIVRDITDRKKRERRIRETNRRLQAVVDTVEASIFIKDSDGRYQLMNEECRELLGLDSDTEVEGLTDHDLFPEDVAERFRADDQRVLERGETIEIEEELPTSRGTQTNLTLKSPLFDDEGEPVGVCAVSTDITDRKERERKLRAARRFNEELVENAPFGMIRLDENLRITYENPRTQEVVGLPDDEDESAAIGQDIRELPSVVATGEADRFGRLTDGETIEFEFPFESIYGEEAYVSGRGVPLYRDGRFDGAVLMATDISDRRRRERDLERQREQLAALNELNDVVRGITEAVIDQSTREEIERVVCDRLAASESYRFAWICAVDSSLSPEPRVEAGVQGYLDDVPLSATPDAPTGHGPTDKAVRTREIQIMRNVLDGTDDGPWQEHARQYRFQSLAVIPIVHGDTLYGVIGVHSERPDAFAEDERDVIGQLGEVVGHAIAALNRKRALMNEEVLELQIRIPNLLESRDLPAASHGRITFDRRIPVGDGEYLLYGTAPADAMDVLHALGERLQHWKALRTIEETDGRVRFEQQFSDPPVASTVADHGGDFADGRIEDGEYRATIHFPPGTDVRPIFAEIRDTYPDIEVISQQQVTREDPSSRRFLNGFSETLTERQQAVLEAGYYAGFFEWPRDMSGEDVAESLDIGASTFHQHIRKAEKKLFDVVFADR